MNIYVVIVKLNGLIKNREINFIYYQKKQKKTK